MARRPRKVLRLSLDYDRDGLSVRRAEVVDGAPVLRDRRPQRGSGGVWVSVETAGRRFARRLPDPDTAREVFAPDGSITRTAAAARREVVIDVPWLGDGAEVIFYGPELQTAAAVGGEGAWRELDRFRAADLAAVSLAMGPPPAVPAFPVVPLSFGTGNPDALRLVFMADGFTAGELPLYRAVVDQFLAKLAVTAPFAGMLGALAALRVDSVSVQSGIDDPDNGLVVDTWLNGRFGQGALRRRIEVDQGPAVRAAAAAAAPHAFVGVVVVNTTEYGGSGGQVAVFSCDRAAADVALHELGHTLFGLADEYSDPVSGAGGPSEPNVTFKPDRASPTWGASDRARLKWRNRLTPGLPFPTLLNPGGANPGPTTGPAGVGAFEGAKYEPRGIFRPSLDCKMRRVNADFCLVCQDVIVEKLKTFL